MPSPPLAIPPAVRWAAPPDDAVQPMGIEFSWVGEAARRVGDLMFPIAQAHVESVQLVSDEAIIVEVKKLLNDAMKRAEDSPLPDPSELAVGVYAEPEELDTPHHK